jgi:hypothetical protein
MPVTINGIPNNHRLWRYFDEKKFIELAKTRSLWFARPSAFGDKNEGRVSEDALLEKFYIDEGKEAHDELFSPFGIPYDYFSVDEFINQDKKLRDRYAVSCWHSNHHESLVMWDLYTKQTESNNGVVLATTFEKMKNTIADNLLHVTLGEVIYRDILNHHRRSDYIFNEKTKKRSISVNDDHKYRDPFSRIFRKDLMFKHEQEVRAVIDLPDKQDISGLNVRVPFASFIDRIIVSPHADESYVIRVKEMVESLGFADPERIVISSNILREVSTKNMRKEGKYIITDFLK